MANKRVILLIGILLIFISTSDNKIASGNKPARKVAKAEVNQGGAPGPTSIFPLKNQYLIRAGEDTILAELYADCPSTATEPARFLLGPDAPDFVYIIETSCPGQQTAKALVYASPHDEQTGKYIVQVLVQPCSGVGGGYTLILKVKPPRGN